MFNSVVLNVVIGLVFIYLLYSLLASIIQEIIATNLGMRSWLLKKAIRRMLDDGDTARHLSQLFYRHPLIKYLGEDKLRKRPSYMTAQNFSKVVVDMLRGQSAKPGQDFEPLIQSSLDNAKMQWEPVTIMPETLSYLNSLWADAEGDIDRFRIILEKWFNDTMEHATGWYKKKIQFMLFFIGLSFAVLFNVDTLSIAQRLSSNPKLAEQLADNAAAYLETHKELENKLSRNTRKQPADSAGTSNATNAKLDSISNYMAVRSAKLIDSANVMIKADIAGTNDLLGLGWRCHCSLHPEEICVRENFNYRSIIGWLLTALAISLGAPFWFDLLNKFIQLRGSKKGTDKPVTAGAK